MCYVHYVIVLSDGDKFAKGVRLVFSVTSNKHSKRWLGHTAYDAGIQLCSRLSRPHSFRNGMKTANETAYIYIYGSTFLKKI